MLEVRNLFHLILRSLFPDGCEFGAVKKFFIWIDLIDVQPSNNNRGSLQMNSFMLNTHHNNPGIRVPLDLRAGSLDHIQDDIFDNISIGSYLPNRGPVIMSIIEIIPVHLVNSDCEDGLKFRVDPL